MKKIIFILIFVACTLCAEKINAQQIGMYSHYFYKPMIYNPAFTGDGDAVNIMLINRAQWSDFKGAPQLNIFTLDGRLLDKKVGLGLQLISDRKGISNRLGGDLSYSYRVKLNDDMHLALGVSFGAVDHTLNYSKALVENTTDPTLFTGSQHKIAYNANAGVAFVWKELALGAAAPQLLGNKVNYVDSAGVRPYYTQARHYMSSLKYKFFISKDKGISIAPQALVRFVSNAPLQYDGNLNFDWNDKFWVGATYKSNYAVAANAGFCINKQLYIGYSYEFITGNIGKYAGMSHEIMVNFKFGNKKEEPKTEAPDFSAYQKRLDSLKAVVLGSQFDIIEAQLKLQQNERKLNEHEEKIKELNDKLNEQQSKTLKQQVTLPQEAVADTLLTPPTSPAKVTIRGIGMETYKAKDFKDENGQTPQKGLYVVAGSYHNEDNAVTEVKRLKENYKVTNKMYSGLTLFHYVVIEKSDNYKDALKHAKDAKTATGIEDVWILRLTE